MPMLPDYRFLQCTLLDKVLKVTITREEKLNAMNRAMMGEITDCFRRIGDLEGIHAVLLTGTGKAFMAGADIEEYRGFDIGQFTAFQEKGREMYRTVEVCPKPVIAAVNGYALGGGFELVLACDIVISAAHAKFGLPEVKLGLVPGGGGVQKISRLTGPYLAKELLFTGRFITAQEGSELQLISQVVERDQLEETGFALAQSLARMAPLAVQGMKKLVGGGRDASLETAQAYDRALLAQLFYSQDAIEGITAFLEKREAVFQGK